MNTKVLLLLVVAALCVAAQENCDVIGSARLDCGFSGMDPQDCRNKGCCWVPATPREEFARFLQKEDTPSNDVPYCFYPSDSKICKDISFEGTEPGFDGWYDGMYKLYMANINIEDKGGVVASPDPNTPGGSYEYHWMRDAALTMRSFMEIHDFDLDEIDMNMGKYLEWVLRVQNESDPNDISVLIEPKFNLPDGTPYTGGWCRPQTDGPGLRSGSLILYANALIKAGKKDQVSQALWLGTGDGAIQKDLDWIVGGWEEEGCDLWEEVRSKDFFWNRMSFYQALTWGSELAETMGDSAASSKYKATAETIKPTIFEHWNGTYVIESTNREKDSAVIHAMVELNEGLYDMTGKEVAGTINTLNLLFCSEYTINQKDDSDGVPGILYGRYENDSYAGGNPWQLLTAALAEAFYKGATVTMERKEATEIMTSDEVDHWRPILKKLSDKPTASEFAAALKAGGDAVMYRMWTHVKGDNYDLSEQMSRETGVQLSAKKLTWSFSNVLRCLHLYTNNKALKEFIGEQ